MFLFLDCSKWIVSRSRSLKLCYIGATFSIWVFCCKANAYLDRDTFPSLFRLLLVL